MVFNSSNVIDFIMGFPENVIENLSIALTAIILS